MGFVRENLNMFDKIVEDYNAFIYHVENNNREINQISEELGDRVDEQMKKLFNVHSNDYKLQDLFHVDVVKGKLNEQLEYCSELFNALKAYDGEDLTPDDKEVLEQVLDSQTQRLNEVVGKLEYKQSILNKSVVGKHSELVEKLNGLTTELGRVYCGKSVDDGEINAQCHIVRETVDKLIVMNSQMEKGKKENLEEIKALADSFRVIIVQMNGAKKHGFDVPKKAIKELEGVVSRLDKFFEGKVPYEVYHVESTVLGRLIKLFEDFVDFFFGLLNEKKLSKLFPGWHEKIRHSKNLKELKAKQKKLDNLQKKLVTKNFDVQKGDELVKSLVKKAKYERKIAEYEEDNDVSNGGGEYYNNMIRKRDENLQRIEALNDEYGTVNSSMEKFQEAAKLREKIQKIEGYIEDFEKRRETGKETRKALHLLGAENVRIEIPDEDAVLSGSYLAADEFRIKMIQAGASKFTLSGPDSQPFEGIAFNKERLEQTDFYQALEDLGINKGSGFVLHDVSDTDYVVLIPEADVQNFESLRSAGGEIECTNLNIDKRTDGGTVIITSGSLGVYEMHKREMLYYLLNGMNVMGFNVRGFGESEGTPSGKGLKHDFAAAYDYLQKYHSISDDKILLKATCMTGGPATSLAAKHPEINVFLDQSYSDFEGVFESQVLEKMKDIPMPLKKELLPRFAKLMAKFFAPDWKTAKDLIKVQGHLGVLWSKDDDLMPFAKQTESIIRAGENAKSCTSYAIEGSHGSPWLKDSDGITQMDSFIAKAGLNGSLI